MNIIKTNKAMRNHYVNHMNKLEDYAKGKFGDSTCYMCSAGRQYSDYNLTSSACDFCPLEKPIDGATNCSKDMRRLNLKDKNSDSSTCDYESATPESIRKHILWIEKQIKERTDCELYWK